MAGKRATFITAMCRVDLARLQNHHRPCVFNVEVNRGEEERQKCHGNDAEKYD
jgi:hypothetical protein